MGRAPCCDKQSVRRGTWSAEEDVVLKLRWLNYLRPSIKHGGFSQEEDDIISHMYFTIGSRWSMIAERLQGRTDNDIKNHWNTNLQRKLIGKQKMSKRRRSSYGGFLQTYEDYNHIDYINNPNSTNFTITNSHLMSSHWTPQKHCNWPPSNMISFESTSDSCSPIINNVGSSSSSMQVQQRNMNYSHNEGNVKLDDILREMEAVLLANDEVDNNVKDVSSFGESTCSWDFGDFTSLISFPMDELDEFINWEQISLPEDDLI
ncbi:hypothetical protein V2J09_010526 [Rumex salicifolius]